MAQIWKVKPHLLGSLQYFSSILMSLPLRFCHSATGSSIHLASGIFCLRISRKVDFPQPMLPSMVQQQSVLGNSGFRLRFYIFQFMFPANIYVNYNLNQNKLPFIPLQNLFHRIILDLQRLCLYFRINYMGLSRVIKYKDSIWIISFLSGVHLGHLLGFGLADGDVALCSLFVEFATTRRTLMHVVGFLGSQFLLICQLLSSSLLQTCPECRTLQFPFGDLLLFSRLLFLRFFRSIGTHLWRRWYFKILHLRLSKFSSIEDLPFLLEDFSTDLFMFFKSIFIKLSSTSFTTRNQLSSLVILVLFIHSNRLPSNFFLRHVTHLLFLCHFSFQNGHKILVSFNGNFFGFISILLFIALLSFLIVECVFGGNGWRFRSIFLHGPFFCQFGLILLHLALLVIAILIFILRFVECLFGDLLLSILFSLLD